jgi:hypothetical protein
MGVTAPVLPMLGVQWRGLNRMDPSQLWIAGIAFGVIGVGVVGASYLPAGVRRAGRWVMVGVIVLLVGGAAVAVALRPKGVTGSGVTGSGVAGSGVADDGLTEEQRRLVGRKTPEVTPEERALFDRWAKGPVSPGGLPRVGTGGGVVGGNPANGPGTRPMNSGTTAGRATGPIRRIHTPEFAAKWVVNVTFEGLPAGTDMAGLLKGQLRERLDDSAWRWDEKRKTLSVMGQTPAGVMSALSGLARVQGVKLDRSGGTQGPSSPGSSAAVEQVYTAEGRLIR